MGVTADVNPVEVGAWSTQGGTARVAPDDREGAAPTDGASFAGRSGSASRGSTHAASNAPVAKRKRDTFHHRVRPERFQGRARPTSVLTSEPADGLLLNGADQRPHRVSRGSLALTPPRQPPSPRPPAPRPRARPPGPLRRAA